MLVTASSPRWIIEVCRKTGERVNIGDIILRFDAYDLERQIFKLQSKLALNAVSAERLTDNYINRYVYLPLDELIDVRRREVVFAQKFQRAQKDRAQVGEVKQAGVINDEKVGTVALSIKELEDAEYAYEESKEEKLKKTSEVNEERAKNASEREEISKSINILKELVSKRTICSPADGVVTFNCVVGQFVDKGDVVAEIVWAAG